jgi:WXG100 family type VII secretion target
VAVDFGAMLSAKKFVREAADQIYKELNNLMSTLETLSPQWDGAAKKAFYDRYNEWQPKAAALRQALYNIGDGLDSSHTNYSQAEFDNTFAMPSL